MTNDPKLALITDSAARSNSETVSTEIRKSTERVERARAALFDAAPDAPAELFDEYWAAVKAEVDKWHAGEPLFYCGNKGCLDSITKAQVIGRQQGKRDALAAHYAATENEPSEVRVCRRHVVSFSGDEFCGICGRKA